MKALVLCGGIPQIALLNELKARGIYTILVDMNEKVSARKYADKFYPISVLDVDAVKKVAIDEKVDYILTVCADQVLQIVAQIAEELRLPWYIDYETAENVSKKSFMKKIFWENDVPTTRFVIMNEFEEEKIKHLNYPIIAKPVDSYSSRGVCKVNSIDELKVAFENAVNISRTNRAIVEEFVEGDEITVDAYVEDGKVHILCLSKLDKIPGNDKFVIHRTCFPAQISVEIEIEIEKTAQKIADAFKLKNCPMLIQLITDENRISVVEFCARTGGGDKFRLIEKATGFDVIKAVVDLTLGEKPHYIERRKTKKYIVNEFLYCCPGIFDHMEGLEELLNEKIISEYFILKNAQHKFEEIRSSGDRVAFYTVEADTYEEVFAKQKTVNSKIKAISVDGKDLLRHDLISEYND